MSKKYTDLEKMGVKNGKNEKSVPAWLLYVLCGILAAVLIGGTVYVVTGVRSAKRQQAQIDHMQEMLDEALGGRVAGTESAAESAPVTSAPETEKEEGEAPAEGEDPQDEEGGDTGAATAAETKGTERVPVIQTSTVAPDEKLSFPCTIEGTKLSVQGIYSYDGVYVEDGSDSAVSGIAVLRVKNTGSTAVEYASIDIEQGKSVLNFVITDLAPGTTVMAEEAAKKPYTGNEMTGCSAETAELPSLDFAPEIKVAEDENGSLTVTNLTSRELPCVRLFYKLYLAEDDVFVGGITYTVKLTNLKAGASETVVPSHYVSGCSKVVMTRVYDTAD